VSRRLLTALAAVGVALIVAGLVAGWTWLVGAVVLVAILGLVVWSIFLRAGDSSTWYGEQSKRDRV
jgi:hypothetical protein